MLIKSALLFCIVVITTGCQKKNESAAPKNATSVLAGTSPDSVQVVPIVKKSYDGPFGLRMGILPGELADTFSFKNTVELPTSFSGTPPKPVPDFTSYFAMATPTQGICILGAFQPVSVVNATGDQLRERVDNVAEMLTIKYGERTEKIDFANQDVYRRNSQFWMMALAEDARTYAYSWENGKKNKTLPNNIESIEVYASASSMSAGSVVIKYYFENNKKCQAEKRAQKAANL